MKLINNSNNFIQMPSGELWNRNAIAVMRLEINEDNGRERLCITNGMLYSYVEGKRAIKEFLKENFVPDTINEIKAKD